MLCVKALYKFTFLLYLGEGCWGVCGCVYCLLYHKHSADKTLQLYKRALNEEKEL